MSYVIFTDVDGTLIDETYRLPFDVKILQQAFNKHRVVFASSRTANELIYLQRRFGVAGDCIVENGGALLLREKSIAECFPASEQATIENDAVWIVPLAEPAEKFIDDVKREIQRHHVSCRIFQDLDAETIAELSGYDLADAIRAKARRFGVLLATLDRDEDSVKKFIDALKRLDFAVTFGGKWLTVSKGLMNGADKGAALKRYLDSLQKKGFLFTSVAVGNEENDATMLESAQKKFAIKNPHVGYAKSLLSINGATLLPSEGALGWPDMLEQLNL